MLRVVAYVCVVIYSVCVYSRMHVLPAPTDKSQHGSPAKQTMAVAYLPLPATPFPCVHESICVVNIISAV